MSDHDIQLWEMIGTWTAGVLGVFFLFVQNTILKRQNKLFESQNELERFLVDRERSASSEEDTRNVIRRIGISAIQDDHQIDREVRRLYAKGLTDRELEWIAGELFKPGLGVVAVEKLRDSSRRISAPDKPTRSS